MAIFGSFAVTSVEAMYCRLSLRFHRLNLAESICVDVETLVVSRVGAPV